MYEVLIKVQSDKNFESIFIISHAVIPKYPRYPMQIVAQRLHNGCINAFLCKPDQINLSTDEVNESPIPQIAQIGVSGD